MLVSTYFNIYCLQGVCVCVCVCVCVIRCLKRSQSDDYLRLGPTSNVAIRKTRLGLEPGSIICETRELTTGKLTFPDADERGLNGVKLLQEVVSFSQKSEPVSCPIRW